MASSSLTPQKHRATATRLSPYMQIRATHPWLQFPEGNPACKRLAALLKKQFATTWTVDWNVLKTLHLHNRARDIMGPIWLRFFSIKHPQYKELCLEFLSTYEFQTTCTDYSHSQSITFRMAGIKRSCSLIEFSKRMGLYTDEEMKTDVFLRGLIDLPGDVRLEEFWAEIAEGPYQASAVKSTRLKDPFHRILHRIIAQSIAGRRESTGVVTERDLFFLYCFIKPAICNVAYALATYFTTCMGKKPTSHICGGSYITQLAKSYGVLTPEACTTLTWFLPTQTIDMVVLTNMQVVGRVTGGGCKLLDGHVEAIWQSTQQEVTPQQLLQPKQEEGLQQQQEEEEEGPQQQQQQQEEEEEGLQQQQQPVPPLSSLDLAVMVTELQQGQQRLEQEIEKRHQETMYALGCIARYFAIPDFLHQQPDP